MTRLMVTCDVCGKVKGEKNGWLEMFDTFRTVAIQPFGRADRDFAPISGEKIEYRDLCGVECVQEEIRRALERQNPNLRQAEPEVPAAPPIRRESLTGPIVDGGDPFIPF